MKYYPFEYFIIRRKRIPPAFYFDKELYYYKPQQLTVQTIVDFRVDIEPLRVIVSEEYFNAFVVCV